MHVENSALIGEKAFCETWSNFEELYNFNLPRSTTINAGYYDFSDDDNDRGKWNSVDESLVEWGVDDGRHVLLNEGGEIISENMDMPDDDDWSIIIMVDGNDGTEKLQVTLIPNNTGNYNIKSSSVTFEDLGEYEPMIKIEYNAERHTGMISSRLQSKKFYYGLGIDLERLSLKAYTGSIKILTVKCSWQDISETIVHGSSNIRVFGLNPEFDSGPESYVHDNLVLESGLDSTFSGGINPTVSERGSWGYQGEKWINLQSSSEGDYWKIQFDNSDVAITARIVDLDSSEYEIGFNKFKARFKDNKISIVNENYDETAETGIIEKDIMVLPSNSGIIHNFNKKGDYITWEGRNEDVSWSGVWKARSTMVNHRNPRAEFGIWSLGNMNINIDYIMIGEQEWENFM